MAGEVRIDGVDEVCDSLEVLRQHIKATGIKSLQKMGVDLLGKAVQQAPVRDGFLRGSGSVRFDTGPVAETDRSGAIRIAGQAPASSEPTCTVGFGVPYAARQHEGLNYRHPMGGKAKYLEDPMKESLDLWRRMLEDDIRDLLGG